MKKSRLSVYYIILAVICQVLLCCGMNAVWAEGEAQDAQGTQGATSAQITAVKNNCTSIREQLKVVQHDDSKMRVYLGRYYEIILNKFIMPLNVRLVENNLSDTELIDNQSNFATARGKFIADFIDYQKSLEELTGMDCKAEPERFYEKLLRMREKRQLVADDTGRLKKLAAKQVELTKRLKEKL